MTWPVLAVGLLQALSAAPSPTASPSPRATGGPFTPAGVVVLIVLVGLFLFLRRGLDRR